MTTITENPVTPEPEPAPAPAPGTSRWRLAALVAAAVAVIAIGVAVFALTRDDSNNTTTSLGARDIAATQQARQACQQWFDNSGTTATSTPYSGWCGYMSDWMYDQMASGHMTGPMMWNSPEAMRDACVQAMAGYQPTVADPTQRCQNMVDWMSQHMGDWDDWMMNPSMMGR